jgi:predicted metal-dependent hydrolase
MPATTRNHFKTKHPVYMNKETFNKILRGAFLFGLIIVAIYLVINCIIAIPLMSENNSKNKEITTALKEELKSIRLVFNNHLNDFQYDSSTLKKYDIISESINAASSSASLKNYLNIRLANYKRTIENAGELFIYKFNLETQGVNYKSYQRRKDFIVQQYKKNCDSAENELTNNLLGVISQTNRLYAIYKVDTTTNRNYTKEGYKQLNYSLFFTPLQINYGHDLDSVQQSSALLNKNRKIYSNLYSLSNDLIEMNSSSLVIILGMLGVGFFGAIISVIRKDEEINKLQVVSNQLFFIIISSLATSVITYLSLQGGITLITIGSDVTLNPYFILFVCFAAAVFSEKIWEKVKGWLN